jgi:hypothetical protein
MIKEAIMMLFDMEDTYTIAAQFESPDKAEAAETAIRSWLAAQGISTESVHTTDKLVFVVGQDADQGTIRKIRQQFQERGGKTLLEQITQEKAITLFMTCRAPDDATAQRIDAEMDDYFHAAFYLGPQAPWESEEESAQDLTEDEARTKATLELLYDSWKNPLDGERLQEISCETVSNPLKLLLTLFSRKRQDRLNQEMQAAIFEALEEGVTHKAEAGGIEIDEELVRDWQAQGTAMGQLAMNYQPRPTQAITGFGGVERDGRQLIFDFVMFHRFAFGFPAMLGYLRDQGCTAFDYRLEDFDDVRED